MSKSICFLIPTKLESSQHEVILSRCIRSIRRLYPCVRIVIAVAKNSLPVTMDLDDNTTVEQNPSFSVFGCLSLFHAHKYADQAWILHDSIVVLKEVPTVDRFSFVYHFHEPSLDIPRNDEGYRRLLTRSEYTEMRARTRIGCFGNMFVIDHSEVERMGLLRFVNQITTKYDFECMERIIGFFALQNGYSTSSVCGDIFDPIANPWTNTQYATMSLDDCVRLPFPAAILKAIIARK